MFLGKDHFPAVWPEEAQQKFRSLLASGVLATVQSFDGSANVLSLTLHSEKGGESLTAMMLDALQAQAKTNPHPSSSQTPMQTDSSTSTASAAVVPDYPQSKSAPDTQQGLVCDTAPTSLDVTAQLAAETPQQKKNSSAVSVKGLSSRH